MVPFSPQRDLCASGHTERVDPGFGDAWAGSSATLPWLQGKAEWSCGTSWTCPLGASWTELQVILSFSTSEQFWVLCLVCRERVFVNLPW